MSKVTPIRQEDKSRLVRALDGPSAGKQVRVWGLKPMSEVICWVAGVAQMHWYDGEGRHRGEVIRGDKKGKR